jgi:hypothetical protein
MRGFFESKTRLPSRPLEWIMRSGPMLGPSLTNLQPFSKVEIGDAARSTGPRWPIGAAPTDTCRQQSPMVLVAVASFGPSSSLILQWFTLCGELRLSRAPPLALDALSL